MIGHRKRLDAARARCLSRVLFVFVFGISLILSPRPGYTSTAEKTVSNPVDYILNLLKSGFESKPLSPGAALDQKARKLYPNRQFGTLRTFRTDIVHKIIVGPSKKDQIEFKIPMNYLNRLAEDSWRSSPTTGFRMTFTDAGLQPLKWENREVFLAGGIEGRISVSVFYLGGSPPKFWDDKTLSQPVDVLGGLSRHKSKDPTQKRHDVYVGKTRDGRKLQFSCLSEKLQKIRKIKGGCRARFMYSEFHFVSFGFHFSELANWNEIYKKSRAVLKKFEVKR